MLWNDLEEKPEPPVKEEEEVIEEAIDDRRDIWIETKQFPAVALSLRNKQGDEMRNLPWFIYSGSHWKTINGEDILRLLFSDVIVTIRGEKLTHFRNRFEGQKVWAVQEHDEAEIDLIRAENEDTAEMERRLESEASRASLKWKAVILSVDVWPPIEMQIEEIRKRYEPKKAKPKGKKEEESAD